MSHIIYRLQHSETGYGPYRDRKWSIPSRHSADCYSKYPIRGDDIKGKIKGFNYDAYFCACHTWALLLSWFNPKEIKYLKSYGFVVVKLKVKKIVIGRSGRQCFFKKKDIIS